MGQLRAIIATSDRSTFYVSRAVSQRMIERAEGGVIINNITPRRNVPYCATKAGVRHLNRGMPSGWARYGLRVNAIAPG